MKSFNGKILFLDRSDINTDEIIPAKYLAEITKEALKPHLLEDLRIKEFAGSRDIIGKGAIVTRANFGCGSSREHAPWALEVNSINLVIAESFARIFRQNMYNCGMMAVELPKETINELISRFSGKDTAVRTHLDEDLFIFEGEGQRLEIPFVISDFDRTLVMAGGWVDFADSRY
jgi:3-isopropylmalate/(R)-2-methylmalate dehydratase small subunit